MDKEKTSIGPRYFGAEDTYRELVEESDQSWLLGLVAFAVVEEQRIEWMRYHEQNNGALPDHDQVRKWYEQQPPGVLLRAKGTAENALQVYSEEVSTVLDAEYRKEIENGIVVGEIRTLNKFWPQFGVNLAGGFASAILFAAMLVLMAVFVFNDTSPVEIVKNIKTHPAHSEGNQDGK
ncbi:MAG: hypothetical protein WAO76_05610 [Georgfuchsia sp.]